MPNDWIPYNCFLETNLNDSKTADLYGQSNKNGPNALTDKTGWIKTYKLIGWDHKSIIET